MRSRIRNAIVAMSGIIALLAVFAATASAHNITKVQVGCTAATITGDDFPATPIPIGMKLPNGDQVSGMTSGASFSTSFNFPPYLLGQSTVTLPEGTIFFWKIGGVTYTYTVEWPISASGCQVFVGPTVWAQAKACVNAGSSNGIVTGTVKNPNEVTDNATVTLDGQTVDVNNIASGQTAAFTLSGLPPGTYTGTANLVGAKTSTTFTVTVGQCATPPTCPSGDTGTYPNCQQPVCPTGDTGTYPNCSPPQCPSGDTGTYPNCTPPPTPTCPSGQIGTYPNCQTPQCAPGQIGTYPNCSNPKCPGGDIGNYPDCSPPKCKTGYKGTPPNCHKPPVPCKKGYHRSKLGLGCVSPPHHIPVCTAQPGQLHVHFGPGGLQNGYVHLSVSAPHNVYKIVFSIKKMGGGTFVQVFHGHTATAKYNVALHKYWGSDSLGYTYGLHIPWKVVAYTKCGKVAKSGKIWNNDPPPGVHLPNGYKGDAHEYALPA
jgi:hypothetical protein